MVNIKRTLTMLLVLAMIISFSANTFAAGGNQPLMEERNASLNLMDYAHIELASIPVRTILENLIDDETGKPVVVDGNATTVWSRFKVAKDDYSANSDAWKVVGLDDTIDMSRVYWYEFEMIIGSGKQLDPNNIRYIVDAEVPESDAAPFDVELYTQDENGVRTPVALEQEEDVEWRRYYEYDENNVRVAVPGYYISVPSYYPARQEYYMGIKPKAGSNLDFSVYSGSYESVDAALQAAAADPSIDITPIVKADISQAGTGLKGDFSRYKNEDGTLTNYPFVTIVYNRDGNVTGSENVALRVYPRQDDVEVDGIFSIDDGYTTEVSSSWRTEYDNEIDVYDITLRSGYDENAEYYISMVFYDGDAREFNAKKVTKAVIGHYDSVEAAEYAEDIKEKLFIDDIYDFYYDEDDMDWDEPAVQEPLKAVLSGAGLDFTVFTDSRVWKLTVKVRNYGGGAAVENGAPNIGSSDRDFRILNAKNGKESRDSYVMPYKYDTYYYNGYQALLVVDEDADLSDLTPVVYLDKNVHVYTDGELEDTDGQTYNAELSPRNFSVGATEEIPANTLKYTVSAENRIDQKNYWVTVVKKTPEAKLYVHGPNEREIFLNDAYNNQHDIFIANIGGTELTGINAVLDAENIAIHEYWNIGGEGNNSLAPFDATNTPSYYSQIPNVAKIRLVPTGEGKIEGTLTITADGQEPKVITLKGQAGNPRIDTESIPAGVKYVPYSSIITTTNMHDWNKVTFSMESGSLPEGVELLPSGEVYGVPKETGEFTFRVKADYSYSLFSDSYADFTFTVEENTDENVDAQTDEGYYIMTRVQDIDLYVEDGIFTNDAYTNGVIYYTPAASPADEGQVFDPYKDQVFEIEGALAEFMDFWLDGEKLVRGVDYDAEEGSTKITIKAQTFKNAGSGTHTIAGEFRKGGDRNQTMAKAAQNYTSGKKNTSSNTSTNKNTNTSTNKNTNTSTNTSTNTNTNTGANTGASTGDGNKNAAFNDSYTIGTQVVFGGGAVYVSSDAIRAAANREWSICEITHLAPWADHPYHLVSIDDGMVWGWVDAENVE